MLNYWKLARKKLLLFGLLPLLAGTSLAWLGRQWYQRAAAFVAHVRPVEGRVLRILSTPDGPRVDIEYLNELGVRFKRQFPIEERREEELRSVGKVSLVYDFRDPRKVELGSVVSVNHQMKLNGGIMLGGILLALAGALLLARHITSVRRIHNLFLHGQLVQTEVRDSKLAPHRSAGRFTYAFRGPNGRWFEGKSPELPAAQLAEWPVGRLLTVAYEAKDPRRTEADIFGITNSLSREFSQSA